MPPEAKAQIRSRPARRPSLRGPLAEQAYIHCRDAIVRGEMPAGKVISYKEICELLKMSRTPVREAMNHLELEGYLHRNQSNRLTVHAATSTQVAEGYWVREILEVHAVSLAARRISDAELAEMDELLKTDREALRTGVIGSLARTNDAIHDLILGASRNRSLVSLVKGLRAKVEGVHTFAVGSLADQMLFVRQHEQIGDALREGDAQTAADLTRCHLRKAHDVLLAGLNESASRQNMGILSLPKPPLLRNPSPWPPSLMTLASTLDSRNHPIEPLPFQP